MSWPHGGEVDERTIKEYLVEGRIKVLLEDTIQLPSSMPIWVEEVKFSVQLEMEMEAKTPILKGTKEAMKGEDNKFWCQ